MTNLLIMARTSCLRNNRDTLAKLIIAYQYRAYGAVNVDDMFDHLKERAVR